MYYKRRKQFFIKSQIQITDLTNKRKLRRKFHSRFRSRKYCRKTNRKTVGKKFVQKSEHLEIILKKKRERERKRERVTSPKNVKIKRCLRHVHNNPSNFNSTELQYDAAKISFFSTEFILIHWCKTMKSLKINLFSFIFLSDFKPWSIIQ